MTGRKHFMELYQKGKWAPTNTDPKTYGDNVGRNLKPLSNRRFYTLLFLLVTLFILGLFETQFGMISLVIFVFCLPLLLWYRLWVVN